MPKFTVYISIALLIASLFLIFNKIFTPQPIQITLSSGQEITTTTAEYLSIIEVYLLIVCSFIVGSASIYLYYNSDSQKNNGKTSLLTSSEKSESKSYDNSTESKNSYSMILHLLKPEEKQVISALKEAKGEMLQNKLVTKLNLSKVKVTRIISSLENKRLITKERYGLTNNIKLQKEMQDE